MLSEIPSHEITWPEVLTSEVAVASLASGAVSTRLERGVLEE